MMSPIMDTKGIQAVFRTGVMLPPWKRAVSSAAREVKVVVAGIGMERGMAEW